MRQTVAAVIVAPLAPVAVACLALVGGCSSPPRTATLRGPGIVGVGGSSGSGDVPPGVGSSGSGDPGSSSGGGAGSGDGDDASAGGILDDAGPGPDSPVSTGLPRPLATLSKDVMQPQHIAVDPVTGNLYVASYTGSYSVVSPAGMVLATYGATGTPHLMNAVGIALDGQGRVYVADYGATAVLVFDAAGGYLRTLDGSQLSVPLERTTGIAIDGSGTIFVTDDFEGRIVKFDAAGNVTGEITPSGDGTSSAAGSTALALDGPELWVTQYYAHRVWHIAPSGAVVGEYGVYGTGGALGTLSGPYDIAVGPGHVLYVADRSDNYVQALDSSGTFLWSAGGSNALGALEYTGIAVSNDGSRLYVSDAAGNRILEYPLGPSFSP